LRTANLLDVELFGTRVEPGTPMPADLPQWARDSLECPTWQVRTADGDLLCLGGFLWQSPSRCSAWWHPLELIEWAKPILLCKAIRRTIALHQDEHTCHRIEAHVVSDWRAANTFARVCGFVFEGCMRRWGAHQENYNLYCWERGKWG